MFLLVKIKLQILFKIQKMKILLKMKLKRNISYYNPVEIIVHTKDFSN